MRILTLFDLLAVVALFAIMAIASVGDALAFLIVPPVVGGAVGIIAGRREFGLAAGLTITVAFMAAGLIAAAG
jgi:hypothetical protein